jgi:hypothetical protein
MQATAAQNGVEDCAEAGLEDALELGEVEVGSALPGPAVEMPAAQPGERVRGVRLVPIHAPVFRRGSVYTVGGVPGWPETVPDGVRKELAKLVGKSGGDEDDADSALLDALAEELGLVEGEGVDKEEQATADDVREAPPTADDVREELANTEVDTEESASEDTEESASEDDTEESASEDDTEESASEDDTEESASAEDDAEGPAIAEDDTEESASAENVGEEPASTEDVWAAAAARATEEAATRLQHVGYARDEDVEMDSAEHAEPERAAGSHVSSTRPSRCASNSLTLSISLSISLSRPI